MRTTPPRHLPCVDNSPAPNPSGDNLTAAIPSCPSACERGVEPDTLP